MSQRHMTLTASGSRATAPDAPVYFVGASAGMKADGKDLAGLPWDFSRGVKGVDGPRYPFLWSHTLDGAHLPLGVVDVLSEPAALPLRIAVRFDMEDEFARRVAAKYRSDVGGLSAVSVSWSDVSDDGLPSHVSRRPAVAHQLLEVSAVNVPMDAEAVMEGARALRRREDTQAFLRQVAAGLDDMIAERWRRERQRQRDEIEAMLARL